MGSGAERMKIAIFSDSFLPYICGVTTSIINQANELTRRGHQVEIYRPKPASDADKSLGSLDPRIRVHDLPISVASDKFPDLNFAIPTALASYSKVRDFEPDIFHTHTEWGCGWEWGQGLQQNGPSRPHLQSTHS